VEVRVEIDTGVIAALMETLKAPDLNEVAALALNDTVKNARVETAQLLRPVMKVPSADIKESLHIEPARPEHLEAAMVAAGKPLKMIEFNPRASRAGVSVQIGGKTEVYRHAFLATMKTGHRGVYERRGAQRLPIRELYGPSVPGMLKRSDVLPNLTAYMESRLLVNLAREIDRRARRNAGHYGGH
jgi:Prophage minor tail protein Z (GPZ)